MLRKTMKKLLQVVVVLLVVMLLAPLAPQAQTGLQCAEEYVVDVGDTLASIAEKTLNDPLAYPALLVLSNAAPDDAYDNIDDPNIIEEGWTVCIPSEEELGELLAQGNPIIEAIARAAGLEPPPPLEETPWVLVGSGDPQNPTVVEPGTVVTAQFGVEGTLAGSGGCNNYSANYEVDEDGAMTVRGPIGVTQAICEAGNEQETAYLDAIQKAKSYRITPDGFLEIEYSSGLLSSSSLYFVAGQAQLKNTQWVLQAYGDPAELQPVEPATTVTAVFTGQSTATQGSVVGFGGCNSYSADYVAQDNRMIIRPPAATLALCPVGSEQESVYLALLGQAETFEILGRQLIITGPGGVLVFSSANLPLEQVLWTLESFGGPGAQQPIPTGLEITALFQPDTTTDEAADDAGEAIPGGRISGSSGCNNYNATYTVERRQLTIGPAAATLMACPADEQAVEQAFFAALATVERYQVLGDQLRLFYDGGEQVITFRANRTPLEETYWKLISYGDVEAPLLPVSGSEITAVFEERPNAPSGVVAGSTGCNSFSAVYIASLSGIRVNPPINNLTFCGGEVGRAERAYLQGLASATEYNIVGNALRVVYDDGDQALNFVASQPPVTPPTAIIEGPAQAQVGETVRFTGSASQATDSPIAQYSWDFGDGTTAQGAVVEHIYARRGVYTARLTVVDERGVSSSTTTQLTITDPPQTSPTAVIEGPTRAFVGQEVTFQGGNSIAGSSPIVVYAWSVSGAQPTAASSDVRFTTRFDEPGLYEVSLAVTDQSGLSDSASLQIEIFPVNEPQTPPTAVIEGPAEAVVGQDITFQGGNSIPGSTPIVVYAWGVDGDQPAARSADVRFTTRFDAPGQYEVSLTITDQNGLNDTASLLVTVVEEPPAAGPTAVIEGPSQALMGEDVTFQGGNSIPGSSPIVVYAWGVNGAQTTSGGIDVSYTTRFDAPGLYEVTLTVTDQNGLNNTAGLQIEVLEPDVPQSPPTAVIEGPGQATLGEEVTFRGGNSTPGSSAIVDYQWDFGNGQGGSGESASTVYDAPGAYPVTLTVTDENGLSNNASQQVVVEDSQGSLEGTTWVLQGTLPDTRITAEFNGGAISGSSGCNSYSGSYSSTRAGGPTNNISIGPLAVTQMACEEAVMTQEQAYLASLEAAQSYTVGGNTLTMGGLLFQGE
jgi:heat shock protein HslJ